MNLHVTLGYIRKTFNIKVKIIHFTFNYILYYLTVRGVATLEVSPQVEYLDFILKKSDS